MKNNKLKKQNHVTYDCNYHLIWTPKYRKSLLINGVDDDLKEIIQELSIELEFEIISMEIMPDHVHLLVSISPQLGVHKVIKRIKGRSSNILRKKYQNLRTKVPTLWTHSYFCATVGGAPLEVIKKYVEDQKEV